MTKNIDGNFRFKSLVGAWYASPAMDTTNLTPGQFQARLTESLWLVLARLTSPACGRVIGFSGTALNLLLRVEVYDKNEEQ